MAESANLIITIQAVNEASRALQDVQRDVMQAGQAAKQSFGGASEAVALTGREVAQTSRTIKVLAGNLLIELNPALGQMVSATSAAAGAARGLSLTFGAVVIGATALATALAFFIKSSKEAATSQREFAEALRTGDPAQVASQLKKVNEELAALVAHQERLRTQKIQGAFLAEHVIRELQAPLPGQIARTEERIRRLLGTEEGRREMEEEQKALESAASDALRIMAEFRKEQKEEQARRFKEMGEQAALREAPFALTGEFLGIPPPEEIGAFRARLDQELKAVLDAEMKFRAEQQALRAGFLGGGGEFLGVPTPEEEAAIRRDVETIPRQRAQLELQGRKEVLAVQSESLLLSRDQRDALEMSRIEVERLLALERARGQLGEDLLVTMANQAAGQRQLNLELERQARENPLIGLQLGLRDVQEDFLSFGDLMRLGIRDIGFSMARSMSDTFFNVVTGEFKKLTDLPRQFGAALIRTMTDIAAQAVTGAAFRSLGQAFGLRAGVPLLLGAGAGGAGQAIAVTPAQAQALQVAGVPVGLSSSGQFVMTGAGAGGGAAGGGFQLPGLPLGGVQGFLPTGFQNFLATPLFAGAGSALTIQGATIPLTASELAIAEASAAGTLGTSAAGFTVGQALGVAGGALGLGLTIYSALQGPPTTMNIVTSGVSGAVSGAVIGTAIAPGIGTAVGAIAGALLGGGAGAFGKGGRAKKPPVPERSLAAGRAGAQALSQAIAGASSLEELIRVMNGQWAPHSEVQIVAFNVPGRGGLRTGKVGDTFQWSVSDLLDPEVTSRLIVQVGQTGILFEEPQLTQQLQNKILELVGEAGGVEVFTEAMLPGGLLRRTAVPGSQASRLAGQPLGVETETLPENPVDREAFLRSLLIFDDDRDLRIVRRDPDTGYVVSVTSFAS